MRRAWLFAAAAAWLGCSPRGVPGSPDVHFNEVVPSNSHSCTDETGASADWIELYNASGQDVDLSGYAMADNTLPLTDLERLGSIVVPAGGVRVIWADERPELGPTHLPFKLNATAERVLLYGPDDALLDRFDWSAAVTDVSFARFPDGTGTFVSCAASTCKQLNGSACAAPP